MDADIKRWLTEAVGAIAPDGEWWKESSRQTYIAIACRMFVAGMKLEQIAEILNDLHWASAEEFGGVG